MRYYVKIKNSYYTNIYYLDKDIEYNRIKEYFSYKDESIFSKQILETLI